MDKVGPTYRGRPGNRSGSFGPPLGTAALVADDKLRYWANLRIIEEQQIGGHRGYEGPEN